jgi:hypothetical protein
MLANLVRDKRGRPIVKSTVENVLNDLEAMGAIEKDDLAMRVDYFTKGLEFENAPNITIDPQFRAVERRDPEPLGDCADLAPPPPWWQYIERAATITPTRAADLTVAAEKAEPVSDRDRLINETYDDVAGQLYPRGLPEGTDRSKAHARIMRMTMDYLRKRGLLPSDSLPGSTSQTWYP